MKSKSNPSSLAIRERSLPSATAASVSIRRLWVAPVRGGATGDLLCRVYVETPVNLTGEQKDLLRQFQATLDGEGNKQSPKKNSWFAGVKSFFDDMKT